MRRNCDYCRGCFVLKYFHSYESLPRRQPSLHPDSPSNARSPLARIGQVRTDESFVRELIRVSFQLLALRQLMQGDERQPNERLGDNFRPPQPLHHRPVRTNIDFNVKVTQRRLRPAIAGSDCLNHSFSFFFLLSPFFVHAGGPPGNEKLSDDEQGHILQRYENLYTMAAR